MSLEPRSRPVQGPLSLELIQERIRAALAAALGRDSRSLSDHQTFSEQGLTSRVAAGMLSALADELETKLAGTLLWEHPTIAMLARHLAGGDEPRSAPAPAANALSQDEPIAIVGIGCRFPEATGPGGYWDLLSRGVDAVTDVPKGRWDSQSYHDADPTAPGRMPVQRGAFLKSVDQFDARAFGISPREAAHVDPQQRLMLEVVWEALEDAGQPVSSLHGSRTGVFVGAMWSDYGHLPGRSFEDITQHTVVGLELSIVSARISYHLGLQGPCLSVNTACSSSLVAVHLACQSLRRGESALALAGGVNLILSPYSMLLMSKFGALAPDGRCKTFDARADGFVRGEGAGVVVLKPLSRAIADGDRVYCVIRGGAVNNDGHSNGLTAPNPRAQEQMLRDACANAGVPPSAIDYVEAHGTGTSLGDPIEANALGTVLGEGRDPQRPLRIGSVKTNVGHLETAAGVAGLIKVALSIQRGMLPRSLHYETPNPLIQLDGLNLRVQAALEPWPAGRRPLAGVSSFGFGGTNCHLVLEGLDVVGPPRTGRQVAPGPGKGSPSRVVFAFGGQGSQWRGMARDLLRDECVFRDSIERCDRAFRPFVTAGSILQRLAAGTDAPGSGATSSMQPTLFAIQVGLAALWRSWGIEPGAVVGQSIGEVAAAHVAGALTLDDAARVIGERSRILDRLTGKGAMAVVGLSVRETSEAIGPFDGQVVIAAESGPATCVVSGDAAAVTALLASLEARGVFCRQVAIGYASHSPQIEPLREEMLHALRDLQPLPARVPLYSTVTGGRVTGDALGAGHWFANERSPMLLATALRQLIADGHTTFLQLDPHPQLAEAIADAFAATGMAGHCHASLRRDEEALAVLMDTASKLAALRGEPSAVGAPPEQARAVVFPLSARSPGALQALASATAELLDASEASLRDLAFTAGARRSALPERLAVVAQGRAQVSQRLVDAAGGADDALCFRARSDDAPAKVAFVFAGHGSQWAGMGRQLFDEEPVFAEWIRRCEHAMRPFVDWRLTDVLRSADGAAWLERTDIVQPAIWALQVALAATWESWGLKPEVVVGHSMGEVAASCVAGLLSLHDAAQVICRRSQVVTRVKGQGGMALVEMPEADVQLRLEPYQGRLSVAVVNSARSTVIAGEVSALDELLGRLEGDGVFCRRVKVDYASHSPLMDELKEELSQVLAGVQGQPGRIPMLSTVTGQRLDGAGLGPAYWVSNLRAPVRFGDAVRELTGEGFHVFLEVSPHPVLLPGIEDSLRDSGAQVAYSLRRGQPDRQALLESAAGLWVRGAELDFARLSGPGSVVPLPSYPWQRERFWLELVPESGRASRLRGHSLLGERRELAVQPDLHLFEGQVGLESHPYLSGHCVQGVAVFPATAYLEMALAAGRERWGGAAERLEQVALLEAMTLLPDEPRTVQLVLNDEGEGRARFRIASRGHGQDGAPGPWALHVTGWVTREASPSLEVPGLVELRGRCASERSHEEVYSKLGSAKLEYSGAFRGIRAYQAGAAEGLGQVGPPAGQPGKVPYAARLDAILQILGLVFLEEEAHGPWLPVQIGSVALHAPLSDEVWVHARQVDEAHGDLIVVDARGEVLLEMRGVRGHRLQTKTEARDPLLLENRWTPTAPAALAKPADGAARVWCVLVDEAGFGLELSRELERAGEEVVTLPYEEGARLPAAALAAWLESAVGERRCAGVVHGWGLDIPTDEDLSAPALLASQQRSIGTLLGLVGAIAAIGWRDLPRLYVLTRGTQPVGAWTGRLAVGQASSWGFGRVIEFEHPQLRPTRLDLDPDPAGSAGQSALVVSELLSGARDEEVAFRRGQRWTAALERPFVEPSARERLDRPGTRPFRLEADLPGHLDRVVLRAMPMPVPGAGDVVIEVHSASLNFIDVLKAMGKYPGAFAPPIPLGADCAGTIVALGAGVEGLRIGQDVVAMTGEGALGSHVCVSAQLTAPRPASLTPEQACAIPAAYCSAWLALHELARLKKGERILIHSASGGTGQAAVDMARRVGAEVFATAGSPEKRDYLRSLGIEHVMDSRTTRFGDEILAATGGAGVDVVLNSLSGAAIEASLRALAEDGRFVELGKKDIHEEDRVLKLDVFKKRISVHAVDLVNYAKRRPERLNGLLRDVLGAMERGELRPPTVEVLPVSEAGGALRKMAHAQHMGKVVLSLEDPETRVLVPRPERPALHADGTYLVTGGLGGLGLAAARWLSSEGVGRLVLVGRRGAETSEQRAAVEALRASRTEIVVAQADVADRAQVDRVLAAHVPPEKPLKGVLHAAGILDDALLGTMTWPQVERVMGPKVLGAWNLHQATRGHPLDLFVLYSSAVSLLGQPGQANYAAANAFLDALAHHRRALGLPSLAVNWTVFTEVGLAAQEAMRGARLSDRGLGTLTPQEGIEVLQRLIGADATQVAALPLDARQWSEFYPHVARSARYAPLVQAAGADRMTARAGQGGVGEGSDEEKRQALSSLVRAQLGRVLRMAPEQIEPKAPFKNLGLDSLMSIEFRNRLESELGLTLSATITWAHPRLDALTDHLASCLGLERVAAPAAPPSRDEVEVSALRAEVAQMSEAALLSALQQELEGFEEEDLE